MCGKPCQFWTFLRAFYAIFKGKTFLFEAIIEITTSKKVLDCFKRPIWISFAIQSGYVRRPQFFSLIFNMNMCPVERVPLGEPFFVNRIFAIRVP